LLFENTFFSIEGRFCKKRNTSIVAGKNSGFVEMAFFLFPFRKQELQKKSPALRGTFIRKLTYFFFLAAFFLGAAFFLAAFFLVAMCLEFNG
jgi:hypothetical protein